MTSRSESAAVELLGERRKRAAGAWVKKSSCEGGVRGWKWPWGEDMTQTGTRKKARQERMIESRKRKENIAEISGNT